MRFSAGHASEKPGDDPRGDGGGEGGVRHVRRPLPPGRREEGGGEALDVGEMPAAPDRPGGEGGEEEPRDVPPDGELLGGPPEPDGHLQAVPEQHAGG